MIISTTDKIEGYPVKQYLGIVSSEAIVGANFVKDFMAGMRDFFGGRSKTYEKTLKEATETAIHELEQRAEEMGGNAVVGIKVDYETVGAQGSMLMVCCVGTVVII